MQQCKKPDNAKNKTGYFLAICLIVKHVFFEKPDELKILTGRLFFIDFLLYICPFFKTIKIIV